MLPVSLDLDIVLYESSVNGGPYHAIRMRLLKK